MLDRGRSLQAQRIVCDGANVDAEACGEIELLRSADSTNTGLARAFTEHAGAEVGVGAVEARDPAVDCSWPTTQLGSGISSRVLELSAQYSSPSMSGSSGSLSSRSGAASSCLPSGTLSKTNGRTIVRSIAFFAASSVHGLSA